MLKKPIFLPILLILLVGCFDTEVRNHRAEPGPPIRVLFQDIKTEQHETPGGRLFLQNYQIARLIIDPEAAYAMYKTPSYSYIYRDIFEKPEKKLGVPCGISSGTLFGIYVDRSLSNIKKEKQYNALNLLKQKLESSESTVIRIELGCHSFIIHKEGDNCHIIQSWIEGYDIDNNLSEFFSGANLYQKIHTMITEGIHMGSAGYAISLELFHGPLCLTGYQNIYSPEGFTLRVEVPLHFYKPEKVKQNFRDLVLGNLNIWNNLVNYY